MEPEVLGWDSFFRSSFSNVKPPSELIGDANPPQATLDEGNYKHAPPPQSNEWRDAYEKRLNGLCTVIHCYTSLAADP